jgi:hypothetical protein
VSYDDLIEVARLCLKLAALKSNATAAAELTRMAEEYIARAAMLEEPPYLRAFQPSLLAVPPTQQQRPQPDGPTGNEKPSD